MVLDCLVEGKIKLKEMKSEVEANQRSRQEVDKFTCNNKLKSLPRLNISPLTSPEFWLTWVGSINRVAADFSSEEIASPQFLSLVKSSINIEEDKIYCANLQSVEDLMSYLKGKYIFSGRMLQVTLGPIERMQDPRSTEIAIKNCENTLRIMKLLQTHRILHQVQGDTLSLAESKTVRKLDQ